VAKLDLMKLPFDFRAHFDQVALTDAKVRRRQGGFHSQIHRWLQHHIPPGQRVLEVGSAGGETLAYLQPARGLGLDFSPNMTARAQQRWADQPNLEFCTADAHSWQPQERFDTIVLDYLAGYLTDIQQVLENLRAAAHPRTRLYLTSLNHLWSPVLALGQALGWVMPQPPSNWLSRRDLINILELAGWEVLHASAEQILPFEVPLLSPLLNRFLARTPPFDHFGATLCVVARPLMRPELTGPVACSVVVPARNESGNIRAALDRIPVLGKATEVIFVEGHSKDDTWEVIQREAAAYDGPLKVRFLQQPGKGKWDAVAAGFKVAQGDVLVIQDADLTAPPEDLPKFFEAVASGRAEFANGSRLVYPMEDQAMRFLNFLGNKFFAAALSYVLRQPIKDSLCGTKMILRSDYDRLLRRIAPFGQFDPFGDFNLLYGSSLLDLRIRDVPVRYRDRTYGETNISRFRHGLMLLRMTWFGLRNLRYGIPPARPPTPG